MDPLQRTEGRMWPSFEDRTSANECVMYGECGKKSFFASPYNCFIATAPKQPSQELRSLLVETCGLRYSNTSTCCDQAQLHTLASSMQTVENFVGACPACLTNLKALWCDYICAPTQASFLNVTATATFRDHQVVREVDFYLDPGFSETLFSSCKDIKFGPDNRFVMEFIGNNAKTPKEFLAFMGQPKDSFGGSPIPIHFPDSLPSTSRDIALGSSPLAFYAPPSVPCNTTDPSLHCSCMDCDASCPVLPPVRERSAFLLGECRVGGYPCLALVGLQVCVGLLLAWAVYFGYRYFRYRAYAPVSQMPPEEAEEAYGGAVLGHAAEDTSDLLESPPHSPATTPEHTPPPSLTSPLERLFYRLGYTCATYTLGTLLTVLLLCAVCMLGLLVRTPRMVTDPVGLWVPPDSAAASAKALFDSEFGPFYRIQQIILSTTDPDAPILTEPHVRFLFQLQSDLNRLQANVTDPQRGVKLSDLCFEPIAGGGCVIESLGGYWQHDLQRFEASDWHTHLHDCLDHPAQYDCLPSYKRPLPAEHVVNARLNSTAMIVTLVNQNKNDPAFLEASLAWELLLSQYLDTLPLPATLRLSYSTESSVAREVQRSTKADFPTIALSYVAMFVYIVVQLRNPGLGVVSVVVVLLSVATALGIFAWAQLPLNFVVLEVMPFLALAIGVDNVFLLVEGYHHVAVFRSIPERIALALAQRGPGCLLCFLMELAIFLTATLIDLPVVTDFARCAALTVTCLFLLQCTLFVAVLARSLVPEMKHRAGAWTVYLNWLSAWRTPLFWSFVAFFVGCGLLLSNVGMGYDPRDALPKDSRLVSYFDDFDKYYHVGPPVYFIVQHANLTRLDHMEALCSKFTSCQSTSVPNLLEQERKRPAQSFLGSPVTTWLDDFLLWLRPSLDDTVQSCCSLRKTQSTAGPPAFCPPDEPAEHCRPCVAREDWHLTNLSRLVESARPHLDMYLRRWRAAPPSETCPFAGGASARDAVNLATHTYAFRLNSVPLTSQSAFIKAYTAASTSVLRELARAHPQFSLTVYSVFHVYFAQYPHLRVVTTKLVSLALMEVVWLWLLLVGPLRTALVLTLAMGLFTTLVAALAFGLCAVPLNAVAVANLVMGIGLGVEFCAHILRAFDRLPPAQGLPQAMFLTGSSVLSGIAWTKLVGIIVLAFAQAPFFRIYFFTLYVCILLAGLAVAFGVLPVLLYFSGGKEHSNSEETGAAV